MNDHSSESQGPPEDPRVRFAAERTLLAWMRTGLALMAFGFVVARFGLFLREIALAGNVAAHQRSIGWSLWLIHRLSGGPVGAQKVVARADIRRRNGVGDRVRKWKGSRLSRWFNQKGIRHPEAVRKPG